MPGYATVAEKSAEWNLSGRRIREYCEEGRVKGATFKGRMWWIPASAKRPRIYAPYELSTKGGKK